MRNEAQRMEELEGELQRWKETPEHIRQQVEARVVVAVRERSDPHTALRALTHLMNNVATPEDYGIQYKSTETPK